MRFSIFCGLVAAFLCLAQSANAQYAGPMHRQKANLVDAQGSILSDTEVLNLVGEEIFNETYVGAKKQYTAGRKMIIGGAIGAGASMAISIAGFNLAYDSAYLKGSGVIAYRNEGEAIFGFVCYYGGLAAAGLALSVLEAGIPLQIIGKKRLDWVAEEGSKATNLTFHAGATPNGIGLTVNF